MTLVDRATSALVDHRTATVSAERLAERLGRWASADTTLAAGLADGIARLVREGELRGGDRLPSERTLAATVAVSRGTIVSAYARLYDDGILDRRQGSGTRIAGAAPTAARHAAGRGEALYATLPSSIDLLRAVPAISPLAVDIVQRHRPVLNATTVEADPAGLADLRAAIAVAMAADGTPTTSAQILVTHGAQQALSLLVEELVSPGDTVLTEEVAWPGLTDAVRRRGGLVHGIRLTPSGIDVEALEAAIVVRRPVLIALNPHNHNPTGVQTSPPVRQRIAELSAEHGITVVEDRVLAHASFDGVTPPSLAALRPDAPIIVVESLSKWAWEGLRVGWLRADPVLVRRLRGLRQSSDLSTSVPAQLLALDLLAEAPALRRDLATVHREAAVTAGRLLSAHLPDWQWRPPRGGLCLWARLPSGSAAAFARHAVGFGVSVAGSAQFASDMDADDHIRIPVTPAPQVLEAGMERLGRAWASYVGQGSETRYYEAVTSDLPERRVVPTSDMLAALAVPSRLAILSHLLSVGAQTATQCADAVGLTASNCSWHLRELAKFGLVERAAADAGDARKRPWRATITGIDLDAGGGPGDDLARAAVRSAWFADTEARFADFLRHESTLPTAWRDAAVISDYAVLVTADELAAIGTRIDEIIRPYIRATRAETPEGGAVASVSIRGIVDPRFLDGAT